MLQRVFHRYLIRTASDQTWLLYCPFQLKRTPGRSSQSLASRRSVKETLPGTADCDSTPVPAATPPPAFQTALPDDCSHPAPPPALAAVTRGNFRLHSPRYAAPTCSRRNRSVLPSPTASAPLLAYQC